MNKNSLTHTTWECKYHLIFAPKYRRQVIYGKIKADIGRILRELCDRKGIEIIEAECCPDHIHMMVRIPPKYSVSEVMGYLKGKSSLIIFDRHANLKYKYGNRHFWCRGYYVDTVGKNEKDFIFIVDKAKRFFATLRMTFSYGRIRIVTPRLSRGFFICGHSPMLLASPQGVPYDYLLQRLVTCYP